MCYRLNNDQLQDRVRQLKALQRPCRLCPRKCGVDRKTQLGFCKQPQDLQVAVTCDHHGEEPAISGSGGAGTVFVSGCTMSCLFCQNHQISQPVKARTRLQTCPPASKETKISPQLLAERLLELQQKGCHNIEWVSPTQHVPALVEALRISRGKGLTLPVVYNSNGYERPAVLSCLHGIVDIYLPDAKYHDSSLSKQLSATADYAEYNRRALREMWRQVGPLQLDNQGIATRGLIIRHLVLPGQIQNTQHVLQMIAKELGSEVWISLMAQYLPAHKIKEADPKALRCNGFLLPQALKRRLTRREYDRVISILLDLKLEHGWIQDYATEETFLPDFDQVDPFAAPSVQRDREKS